MGHLFNVEGVSVSSPGLFTNAKLDNLYALAVRSGDVAASVPEPGTVVMMTMGLGLLGFARRKRRLCRLPSA